MSKKKAVKDDNVTFDMYHFFSRWDVIAMIIFILAMLCIILYQLFTGGQVA